MSFLAVSSISRLKKVVVRPSEVFLYPLQLDSAVASSSSSSGSSEGVVAEEGEDEEEDEEEEDGACDGLGIGGAELDEGAACKGQVQLTDTYYILFQNESNDKLTYIGAYTQNITTIGK